MQIRTVAIAAALLALSLACAGVIEGNLTLDGQPFNASTCRSGTPSGFTGVDLIDDATGDKLRVAQQLDGTANVLYFPGGAGTGTDLGTCGTVLVTTQNSTINDVVNVMGDANLSCSGAYTVAGQMHFENCH